MSNRRGCRNASVLAVVAAMVSATSVRAQFRCETGEFARLPARPARPDYRFGHAVALHRDAALVAARDWIGRVDVLRFRDGRWAEEAELRHPNEPKHAVMFGSSVSLRDDVAVIGARQDSIAQTRDGAAYVYRLVGDQWNFEARLTAPDRAANDEFGAAVAIHDDRIIVGAPQPPDNGGGGRGRAYIFHFDGREWTHEDTIAADDGGLLDEFGNAVAVFGDFTVVGAWNHDNSGRRDFRDGAGAVYVFRLNHQTGRWEQEAKLPSTAPLRGQRDRFGRSVSLDSDALLVGTEPISFADPTPGGSAYVFRFDGRVWQPEAKLVSSELRGGDRFGAAVSLSGDIALVGAWGRWDGECPFPRICLAGAAYVFRFDNGDWIESAKVESTGLMENDLFGWSVSVDGSRALIGTQRDDAVFFFTALSDCNGNDGLDLCDIARGVSRDDNGNGYPDECDCTGRERIGRTRCKPGRVLNRLTVALKRGRPLDAFEVELSTGQRTVGTLDRRGTGRAKLTDVPLGEGTVRVTWQCGASAERSYRCP
ncbi:MAG: hypothetical protein C4547_11100 [Phycisphaerales bacterium]|nr:MAG: hypothetical protein C4547_11100 [Phycisphaerales bacterium]